MNAQLLEAQNALIALMQELESSELRYNKAVSHLKAAQSAETVELNRLNAAQAKLSEYFVALKKGSPLNSDWKREIRDARHR